MTYEDVNKADSAPVHRLVIVDRLSELDWLVEVVNGAVKEGQSAN